MKKLFGALLALVSSVAFSATTVPVQLLNPAGSTAGQAIISTGPSSAPAWTGISATTLTGIVPVANGGTGTGALTQYALLEGNGTSMTALAPGATGTIVASNGTSAFPSYQTLSALGIAPLASPTFTGTVTIPGGTINNSAIGGTTPAAGAFTTLNASANDALLYGNTGGQSIANNTATTVTGWTKIYDRVNTNFNASTGIFTAPATGYYLVAVQIAFAAAATGAGNQYSVTILNNGSVAANGQYFAETATSLGRVVRATAVLAMTSGQTITVQAYQASGGAVALSTTGNVNTVSIARLP